VALPLAGNTHQMSPMSPKLKKHESRILKEKNYFLVGTNSWCCFSQNTEINTTAN